MNNTDDKKQVSKPESARAASACYRMSKKDKYAWIGLAAAIMILLLAWWARSH